MIRKQSGEPLRVMFLVTSMPVGGAETLLREPRPPYESAEVRPRDRVPERTGTAWVKSWPRKCRFISNLISHKFDVLVLWRLWRLMRKRQIDAVVTVGAGDKMFWGRLAAKLAGVPVIASALHSTGWPDSVGKLNRLLTPITDAFIGVADCAWPASCGERTFSAEQSPHHL